MILKPYDDLWTTLNDHFIPLYPIPSLETPMEHEVEQKEEEEKEVNVEEEREETPPIVQAWIRPYFCMVVYILARVALWR